MKNRNLFLALFVSTAISTPLSAQEVIKRTQGQLVMENVPITPDNVREKLIQYQNVRSAGMVGFTKSGQVLISTRFGEANQIHLVKMPKGARNQLTYYSEPVGGAQMRPKHNQFVFSKDKGGDEFHQFYLYDLDSGETRQLTEAGTRNDGILFSDDGKYAVWSVSRDKSAMRDIVMMEVDKPESKKILFSKEGSYGAIEFSPDGKQLLMGQYVSVTKSKRFLYDIASGNLNELTPELNVSYDGGSFTKDGNNVLLVTDENSDFAYGVNLNLKTQKRTRVTPKINWDVTGIGLSPDYKKVLFGTNEDGISKIYLGDAAKISAAKPINLPVGTVGGIRWNDAVTKLGISVSTATTPSDVFVYDLKSKKLAQWTESEIGGLNPKSFVTPKLVRYPTFDEVNGAKRKIPAFVYEPKTSGKHPVIISIHGGPESQSQPNFSSTYNYWLKELDAAVIVPNVRGSTGYGKNYVDLDNGYKREDSVKDIGALLDWIETQPNLDKSKVAVYGGSYGGYMVLASMTNYNDRLAGGVDIVGISNYVTFLENTQSYRRDLRRVEYGDERDPKMREFMEKIAPLNNAHKITKPLFVIQGKNDPRVPQSEAEQIVAKVRSNGGKVWYMLANDEGHGFAKKSNRDAQREAETLFFKEIFGIK